MWTRPLAAALLAYAAAGALSLLPAVAWSHVALVTGAVAAGTVTGLAIRQATVGGIVYAASEIGRAHV